MTTRSYPEGDLGAREDTFLNGRPYRVESWYTGGLSLITIFFSTLDIESASPAALLEMVTPVLAGERVPEQYRVLEPSSVHTISDASGNKMYSLSFVVAVPE